MRKFLFILPVWLFIAGCAEFLTDPILESSKVYYIGKHIAPKTRLSSSDGCIMSIIDNGKVTEMSTVEKSDSLFKITDVGSGSAGTCSGYYLKAEKENDNREYRIYITRDSLSRHILPNLPGDDKYYLGHVWLEEEEFNKMLKSEQERRKQENERQEKEKAQRKKNIAQFEKACPECANIYLVHNDVKCPLSMSLAISQCRNIKYKKDSSKRISVYLEECPGGDGSVVFSYGTQFAQVESLSINGRYLSRNIFTAEELDSTVFSWCWIALTTNNK